LAFFGGEVFLGKKEKRENEGRKKGKSFPHLFRELCGYQNP